MDKFLVYNSSLSGSVKISGSKNAALPIMAATLLTECKCILHNIPDLMDVRTMIKILEVLGKRIDFKNNTLIIRNCSNKAFIAPYNLVRTMRASFCCLGPLLGKRKKAKVALPGGCVIGPRPVDLHLKGLQSLGAQISIDKGYCLGKTKQLKGAHIYLGGAFGSSVLATANVLMAAVLADGETVIEHAACEPEIESLAIFLNKIGAKIQGHGSPIMRVKGVKKLSGCEFNNICDRIEVGTFIAASLATRSALTIKEVEVFHLTSVIDIARKIGAEIKINGRTLFIKPKQRLNPINITTLCYPGFPTDLQAQFMAALSFAKGISLITEKIYPDRFMHVGELNRMGAAIQRSGPHCIIEGKEKLFGAEIMASDLRASAALVIAGLAAQGKTEILRVYHIDRGYEKIENKLKKLGAKIVRKKQ